MPPLKKFLAAPLLFLIWIYQKAISPFTPATCRYTPTCSSYTKEAIILHGPFKGSWIGTKRICRCHPFHEGGYDPVPGSEEHRSLLAQQATEKEAQKSDPLQKDQ